MFSKKKDKVFSWLDKMLSDRRKSFRYRPLFPVSLYFYMEGKERAIEVKDISADGCSFIDKSLKVDDQLALTLKSHTIGLGFSLDLRLKVLRRSGNGHCYCRFIISEEKKERLHKFLFKAQAYDARYKKKLYIKDFFCEKD